jgi:hypothetical protein
MKIIDLIDRQPTATTFAHDLLTGFVCNGFGKKDRVDFHENAPSNSARRKSCAPAGPVNDKETGSLTALTANVNRKKGQHNRSLEINSAILATDSVLFGSENS